MKRALAIDIGGRSTKLALAAADGSLEQITSLPTPAADADEFLRRTFDSAAALAQGNDIAGVGISVAGFVRDDTSAMFYNPNIPWLQGYPLRRAFEDRFGVPVALDADSNAACVAEYRLGVGRGAKRFLSLVIGTGVGGGMIVGGEVVRLAHGGLGDIGHVIVEPFGMPCDSGCYGCAEATVSAPGIEARARRRFDEDLDVRQLIERARRGDQKAIELFAETGRLLAVAIASQAVILFPDVVAIAGGVAEAGDLLIGPAREAFQQLVGPFYRQDVTIAKAELGWQASLVGAALPLFH